MKRPILSALIIGLVAVGVVVALYGGLLLRLDLAIAGLLSRQAAPTRTVGGGWQYFFVFVLAGGVAWFAIQYPTRTGFGDLLCPTSSALAVTPPSRKKGAACLSEHPRHEGTGGR